MKKTFPFIILTLLFFTHKYSFCQYDTGIKPIIENEVYVIHSELYLNSNPFNTSNIFLLKGTNDTVWIFGAGYGEPIDIQFYKNNSGHTTSGVQNDAYLIDSVIQNNFGISNTAASLQFIVPHFHLDHINQELITELKVALNYNLINTSIYVHTNDFFGSTCSSPCCGDSPCNSSSPNFASPYDPPWDAQTLSKFVSIGQLSDVCNQVLMNITTSYGFWEVAKADNQHTSGTLNLLNSNLKLKIRGAAPGTECITPNDWQLIPIHGNLNLDSVIILSIDDKQINANSMFSISPNPSNGIFTLEILNLSTKLNGEILIYSIEGKKLKKIKLISHKTIIDISNFTNGVYFVVVKQNDKSWSTKIIKK